MSSTQGHIRPGKFDHIRDYARAAFEVKDLTIFPRVLALLAAAPEFEVLRAKNRLAPDWDPCDSAGYRDYQLLVKAPGAGWIIELQVIPTELYTLKRTLGHGTTLESLEIVTAARPVAIVQGGNVFECL